MCLVKLFISLQFSLLYGSTSSVYLLSLIVGVPLNFESVIGIALELCLSVAWQERWGLWLHESLAFPHAVILHIKVLLFGQNSGLLVLVLLDLPLLFVVDALKNCEPWFWSSASVTLNQVYPDKVGALRVANLLSSEHCKSSSLV